MRKVITIVGARPQFIKAAVLSEKLKGVVAEKILHTGQHYDHLMSDVLFNQLSIPKPSWHLNCGAASHGEMTGKMLIEIEAILQNEKPDAVLVYGDTNSTLAGALAAAKLHIPIWHVESGVRSFNKKMPEEINRVVTDRITDIHFAPSETACANLLREGINQSSIHNVGDVMLDLYLNSLDKEKAVDLSFSNEPFLLLTLHRAENFEDDGVIIKLFESINLLANSFKIVFPIHPRVKKIISEKNIIFKNNIHIYDPFDYYEMIYVLKKCTGVITDSGGLQKEAFYACKPCVTVRHETEWVELVDSGWNMLVSPDELYDKKDKVVDFFKNDFSNLRRQSFYGNSDACDKIVKVIRNI